MRWEQLQIYSWGVYLLSETKTWISSQLFSKILFVDTDQLSKIRVFSHRYSSRILLIDFRTVNDLQNAFHQMYFSEFLLVDFTMATYLKSGPSQRYFWKVFFIYVLTFYKKKGLI